MAQLLHLALVAEHPHALRAASPSQVQHGPAPAVQQFIEHSDATLSDAYSYIVLDMLLMWQVTDLGQVLHMVGGTAASYMIFFLPGMLLLNAAIVKRTASMMDLEAAEVSPHHC